MIPGNASTAFTPNLLGSLAKALSFFLTHYFAPASSLGGAQALHGLAPICKLINMHELINMSTNSYVTLLPCENGANVNNKG